MTIAAWYRPVYDKLRISKRFASPLDVLNIPGIPKLEPSVGYLCLICVLID
jgi:hypothetical protein